METPVEEPVVDAAADVADAAEVEVVEEVAEGKKTFFIFISNLQFIKFYLLYK